MSTENKQIDIHQDIIKKYFGETVDEGGGTIGYHLYPTSDITMLVQDLYNADKRIQEQFELKQINKKESDEFWDSIFVDDYPFNKENAYNELADYHFLLEQLPLIYMEVTGGILSKTTYFASSVIEAFNDYLERLQQEKDEDYEKRKNVILNKLKGFAIHSDNEYAHGGADKALIEFIDDEEISDAYDEIDKWYS
ncbi:MAG: hypothetical protein WCG95_00245 [bacterium]